MEFWSREDLSAELDVVEHRRSFAGHTIYRVVLKVLTKSELPVVVNEIFVWRRYNEIKKLHKELKAINSQIDGADFPEFVKAKVFGRFEEHIIEERQRSAVNFLKYVAKQPRLCKSLTFKKFFEGAVHSVQTGQPPTSPLLSDAPIFLEEDHDRLSLSGQLSEVSSVDNAEEDVGCSSNSQIRETWNDRQPTPEPLEDRMSVGTMQYIEPNDNFGGEDQVMGSPVTEENCSTTRDRNNKLRTTDQEDQHTEATGTIETVSSNISPQASGEVSQDANENDVFGEFEAYKEDETQWLRKAFSVCSEGDDIEKLASEADETLPIETSRCKNQEQNLDDSIDEGDKTSDSETDELTKQLCDLPILSSSFVDEDSSERTGKSTPVSCLEASPDSVDSEAHSALDVTSNSDAATAEWEATDYLTEADSISVVNNFKFGLTAPKSDIENEQVSCFEDGSNREDPTLDSNNEETVSLTKDPYNAKLAPEEGCHDRLNNDVLPTPNIDNCCNEREAALDSTENNSKLNENGPNPPSLDPTAKDSNISGEVNKEFSMSFDDKMKKRIQRAIEHDDYIYQASLAMSEAIDKEDNQQYQASFDLYKLGIGLLLQGAQQDNDEERRTAVRRKTAQYLLRAENMYRSCIINSKRTKDTESIPLHLGEIKTLGLLDNVALVERPRTEEVFVMKVLHKCGAEYKNRRDIITKKDRNYVKSKYMVELCHHTESNTGIYLFLEYIPGGLLWNHLEMDLSWSSASYEVKNASSVGGTIENPTGQPVCTPSLNQGQNSASLSENPVSEKKIRRWAAEIVSVLGDLHKNDVVCRDLNPRNLLLDSHGHIKLTYFSKLKGVEYFLNDAAMRRCYAAPEAQGVFPMTKAADWWSLGAILFELLTQKSLHSCYPDGIHSHSIINLPKPVSNEAWSLLAGLLRYNPKDRLVRLCTRKIFEDETEEKTRQQNKTQGSKKGSGVAGCEEVKSHPFFAAVDWNKL